MCCCIFPVLFYTFDRHGPQHAPSVHQLAHLFERDIEFAHVFTQSFGEPGPVVLHAYTTPDRLRVTSFECGVSETSGLNGVKVSVNGCICESKAEPVAAEGKRKHTSTGKQISTGHRSSSHYSRSTLVGTFL